MGNAGIDAIYINLNLMIYIIFNLVILIEEQEQMRNPIQFARIIYSS